MLAPRVTIGIPTFNRSAYLEEAISSAIGQTYANLEIIVSDNASTDDTCTLLSQQRDKRIVVTTQPENLGMVGNWNGCLTHATGDYFLLLSDDDVLEPDAVSTLLSGFQSGNISLSYARVQYMDPTGNLLRTKLFSAPKVEAGEQFFLGVLAHNRAAFPSATLFKTANARSAGGYPDL